MCQEKQWGYSFIDIKDIIPDGISVVRNDFNTLIWLKLNKTFLDLENDVFKFTCTAACIYGRMFHQLQQCTSLIYLELLKMIFNTTKTSVKLFQQEMQMLE